MTNVRNFCIIAHIDHGKSTLADRFLELTGTIEGRKMQNQYLDQMDLERERGITIKLQPVRMDYSLGNISYVLNLIDTPGHVDFSYEVSRSLAAVEGAILLVDATKGIQAQTLANLALAQAQELVIVPVVNKIDAPNAKTDQVVEELAYLLNMEPESVLRISARDGTNVEAVLARVIQDVPPPKQVISDQWSVISAEQRQTVEGGLLKALIFDSTFDAYKGVVAYVRVFSGSIKRDQSVIAYATGAQAGTIEVGYFKPNLVVARELTSGDIGYIATGLKDPGLIRVGDTITGGPQVPAQFKPLSGYREARPMVFGSFFPEDADDYDLLRDSLAKLKLTDAALAFEPESSVGLGRGFRVGFLGMLHLEIVTERLKREFGLNLIVSTPSVEHLVTLKSGEEIKIRSAARLPDPSHIISIAEPIVGLEIITPHAYLGGVMDLVAHYRNAYIGTEYIGKDTAVLRYDVPLAEIVTDFYDKLKSVSSGYASMSYEMKESRIGDLVRLDILVAGDIVEPFSRIVPREKATYEGRLMVQKLKDVIPPQWFMVAIQAAVGGKILARESISARRKDVTGYLYGGDVTRKMKLLEKQKRGKKKMEEVGKVSIPHDVFLKMLKR